MKPRFSGANQTLPTGLHTGLISKKQSAVAKWAKRCSLALLFVFMLSIFTVGMLTNNLPSITETNQTNSIDVKNIAEAAGAQASTIHTWAPDFNGTTSISYTLTLNGKQLGFSHGDQTGDPNGNSTATSIKADGGWHSGADRITLWLDVDLGTTLSGMLADGYANIVCTATGYKSGNTDTGYMSVQSSGSAFTQYSSSQESTAYTASQTNGQALTTSQAAYSRTFTSGRYVRFYVSGTDNHNFLGGEWGWIEMLNPKITLNITAFSGSGTSGSPFSINSLAKLQALQKFVNTYGWTMANRYLRQDTSSITAGSMIIGTSSTNFCGKFNGNGYTINLSISNSSDYQALFGYTGAGCEISSLTISGSVSGGSGCGGFVGRAAGSTTITNCTNNANVSGTTNVGGFVGYVGAATFTITNCTNNGSVTGTGNATGGFIGYGYYACSVSGGTNYGTVSNSGASSIGVGGIVGYMYDTCSFSGSLSNQGSVYKSVAGGQGIGGILGYVNGSYTINITGPSSSNTIKNLGTVGNSNAVAHVGGIIGTGNASTTVKNCSNENTVTNGSANYTGGIIGYANGSLLQYVSNTASVSSSGSYVGGVAGSIISSGSTLEACANSATVSGANYVGGIAGEISGSTTNSSYICQNLSGGNISGASYVGGIAGRALSSSNITNAKNYGNVTATSSYSGGIVGHLSASSIVSGCLNSGTITGNNDCGGVVGYATDSGTQINNCTNEDPVNVTGDRNGGIVGHLLTGATVSGCTNSAAVTYTGTSASYGWYTGGIVGQLGTGDTDTSTVTTCENSGTIKASQRVGGIVGNQTNGTIISQCKNSGIISLSTYVATNTSRSLGGIVGYSSSTSANSILRCYNTANITKNGSNYPYYAGGIVGYLAGSITVSGVVNKCYSDATTIEYSGGSSGGIAGNSYTKNYAVVADSWAYFTYVTALGTTYPSVSMAASQYTGHYFTVEDDIDCTISSWSLHNFDNATINYGTAGLNISNLSFVLTPAVSYQNGYYFRLATARGGGSAIVTTSSFTATFDVLTKKVSKFEGAVSTTTGQYNIILSYEPMDFYAKTIYNRAPQEFLTIFDRNGSDLVSNCYSKGVLAYDFTTYDYYLDMSATTMTDVDMAGANFNGGAPMNVNYDINNGNIIPYGVVIGIRLASTQTFVGFATLPFTINPTPLELSPDTSTTAYTYNGRLQAVGAAIINIATANPLFAALLQGTVDSGYSYTIHDTVFNFAATPEQKAIIEAFILEYDLGLVEAGAELVDYSELLFATSGWYNGVALPTQINNTGTYKVIPDGSIAGNGIKNYLVYNDNGLSTNTTEFTVTIMKKSITLSDFIQHVFACNAALNIDYKTGSLIFGKYYDNHLFSSPELFNLAIATFDNTHVYHNDSYKGSSTYINMFDINYTWSQILPNATWQNYLPAKYKPGGASPYPYNLSLVIDIAINDIAHLPYEGSDFTRTARQNFNFGYSATRQEYYYMRLTLTPSGNHSVQYSTDGQAFVTTTTSSMTGNGTYSEFSNSAVTLWYKNGINTIYCTPRQLNTVIKDVGFGFNTYMEDVDGVTAPQLYFDNAADAVGKDYNQKLRWGATENPYWILNATQLQLVADVVNGTSANTVQTITWDNSGYYGINWFTILNQIVIDKYTNWRFEGAMACGKTYSGSVFRLKNDIGLVSAFVFAGAEQKPIGLNAGNAFSGTFDGNDLRLKVSVYRNQDYSGIFGYISQANLKNVNIEGLIGADSGNYRGSLVGYAYNSAITNCSTIASINAQNSNYVGGLIGYLDGGDVGTSVNGAQNLSTITPYAVHGLNHVGGIIGKANGIVSISGEITNTATVRATSASGSAGGIIGSTDSSNMVMSTLNNAVNKGAITSSKYVGGIVGYLLGNWQVKYCFNMGNITVTFISSTDVGAGGVVGYNASSVAMSAESSAIAYAYHEYIQATHGMVGHSGFASAPTTIGGIVGKRNAGDDSPQVFNSWVLFRCTDAQRNTLGWNTGTYDDNDYVYGKFILMAAGDGVNSYVYGMSYYEWLRVVGNVTTTIEDNGQRSASDQYGWGSGVIGLGNLHFKMSAKNGEYIRISVYGGSNFANSTIFMLDVTKGDPNSTLDDETYWQGNDNSLVCLYIQSKASAANLVVGFGAVTAKDPMFIGETYYTENDILQLMTGPAFSENSSYFNLADGVRRTYVDTIYQIDGPDANTNSWDKGDTVAFTVYIYYYFTQVAATTEYYNGYVKDLEGDYNYNRTTGTYVFVGAGNGEYSWAENIGLQEGILVGKASFNLEIQNLVVEFAYSNFVFTADTGANVSVNGDGFSKYYDNSYAFYGTITQPALGDETRYPFGIKTPEVKAYFDSLTLTIQTLGSSYYAHYGKSTNPWVTASYFSTANHSDSTYGFTKAVSDNLYVWFCISITTTELSEYENISFANPFATTPGTTCVSGDQTYIWIATPVAVASILHRPVVITPKVESKNYDGVGYTEKYTGTSPSYFTETLIGDPFDGNNSVIYSGTRLQYTASYPDYARFATDTSLPISSVSGYLKGTFAIQEMDLESIVIASGTSRTPLTTLMNSGTATAEQASYLTSTGSEIEGKHRDGREIYIPGRYCYTINNFATVNATNYDIIFDNGYDEATKKWIVGNASGQYDHSTGTYTQTRSTTYFEIKGWQSSDYSGSISISGTTNLYAGGSQRAMFAQASQGNVEIGAKTGNLVQNNNTVEDAFHSDRIKNLNTGGEFNGYGHGYNFAYNSNGQLFDYREVEHSWNVAPFSKKKASGYGWGGTTDTQTFWVDVYFTGDLLREALKGTLTASVNVRSYSGFANDDTMIGIGVIGYSNHPATTYDANGNLIVQTCTSSSNAMNGMDSYRLSNGDLNYTSNVACSTFIPAGARGVRMIVRVIADGDMAAVYTELYLNFKRQFTQASSNNGVTINVTNSNGSQTLTATNSTSGSGNNLGTNQWNYSAPTAVKYYLDGHGLEFDNTLGSRATMGLNINLNTSLTNWNQYKTLRLSISAVIGTTGSSDAITIGLKAGHTSLTNGNMSLDNTIYWNGYLRTKATTDGSGDNNKIHNIVLNKEMFDSGGLLAGTTNQFTIIFDAKANGGMGFSVKSINIIWQWVVPKQVPTTVSSNNTLANGNGGTWLVDADASNSEGLWNLNNAGLAFFVGMDHTTSMALKNSENRMFGTIGEKKPGLGFNTNKAYTYGLLGLAFDMTNLNTTLQNNLNKSLSDFNLRINYTCEDAAIGMFSTPDIANAVAYPGVRYGVSSTLNEANNFGVNESEHMRLGFEQANDFESHSFTISLAVVAEAEYGNIFTLFFYFKSEGSSNLDWYIHQLRFTLEEGGVQNQKNSFVMRAEDNGDKGTIRSGYTTNGTNFTPLGYNAVVPVNRYTPYGKIAETCKDYLWGSGTQPMNYNSTTGIGYQYDGSSDFEKSGYAQLGTSVYLDATSVYSDGKTLLQYANQGRLRVSYEAVLQSTGTADRITAGIYKRGMQKSSQFSPMFNSELVADNLFVVKNETGTDMKLFTYYFYPYVAVDASGNPISNSANTLTQGTGTYANLWGFSVFFQDITTNALEIRLKFLNVKVEVIDDFEYDSMSYLDDYDTNDTAQSGCDTYAFDTRARYYSGNTSSATTSLTSTSYTRSYTKAWGFANAVDSQWWISSEAKNAELTHNYLNYSNYGSAYTNTEFNGQMIGYGYESTLGDVLTDTVAGSIGTLYVAPTHSTTIGFNVSLTDRIWRLIDYGKVAGIRVQFNWLGMPNYNNKADNTGTSIKTGLNTFYAGWSDKLFSKSVLGSYADNVSLGITQTPYSNPRPITLNTSKMVNYGSGTVTESLERVMQSYGSTSGTNYIDNRGVAFDISVASLMTYVAASKQFSIFFASTAYSYQNSMYVGNIKIELIPVQGDKVDSDAARSQVTDDSYAPESPTGVLPYVLDGQINNVVEDPAYYVNGTPYNNNEGSGIGAGRYNYYYNNKFYYSLGSQSVGAYTEYLIEFVDVESTLWGFEIWLGNTFRSLNAGELLTYTGARFRFDGTKYVFDKNGTYVPQYRLNTSISKNLKDWPDQSPNAGVQWAVASGSNYVASYELDRADFNGYSVAVNVTWRANEAQFEGDYTTMFGSMQIKLVSDATEPINLLGMNCLGMTGNTLSLATSRYDGTAPNMLVKTVTKASNGQYDLDCDGSGDTGTLQNVFLANVADAYSISAGNYYRNTWFTPTQNTLIAEFTDVGVTGGQNGSVSSGLGLLMPMRMVMVGSGAAAYYEWQLDTDELHVFKGSWQWYDSALNTWKQIDSMSGANAAKWFNNNSLNTTPMSSIIDPLDPSSYNIDYVDFDIELTEQEIVKQLYMNEMYLLTKYFVNVVRGEVTHSTVNSVDAVRIRYVRPCNENNTFFFAAYDAAGNISTDPTGENGRFLSLLYQSRKFNNDLHNTDTTKSDNKTPASIVTGYVRNIERIFVETLTVSYYNIATQTSFSSSDTVKGITSSSYQEFEYTPQNGYMFIGWNLNTTQCVNILGAPNYLSGTRMRYLDNTTTLSFKVRYNSYNLAKTPHRQTLDNTYWLMPVQKPTSVSVVIQCFMAPIELNVTESGVSRVVGPGTGAAYNSDDKEYDGLETKIAVHRIGKIQTASTEFDGINNPGMEAVGVVDPALFKTNVVTCSGTGASIVNNPETGFYATMTECYIYNSSEAARVVTIQIVRQADDALIGSRQFSYTIRRKALAISFAGTGGSFTYDGDYHGYNLNVSGIVGTNSVQLNAVSVSGNIYLNETVSKRITGGDIPSAISLFKNTGGGTTYSFKSVNVNYSGSSVVKYRIELKLSTASSNLNYTLASNAITEYTITRAAINNLNFNDAAVVYSGDIYYLAVYETSVGTTSLTKTNPHTAYSYNLQYTNKITNAKDIVNGSGNTSVVYSGPNAGHSDSGEFTGISVVVKHPNYTDWSKSGIKLTVSKAKLSLAVIGGKTIVKEYDKTNAVSQTLKDTVTQGSFYNINFVSTISSYSSVPGIVIDRAPTVPNPAVTLSTLIYNNATAGTGKTVSGTASLLSNYTTNYELTSTALSFAGEITKKTITVSWAGESSYVYTAGQVGPSFTVNNSLAENLGFTMTVLTGADVYFNNGSTPFGTSTTQTLISNTAYPLKAINYGSYSVSVSLNSTTNYSMQTSSFNWEITKRQLTLSWKLNGTTVPTGSSVTYNGAQHNITYALAGSLDTLQNVYITMSGETSATDVKITGDGYYSVSGVLEGSRASNYTLTGSTTFTWKINPRSVSLINWVGIPSGGDITYTYNGQEYGTVTPGSMTPPYITASFNDVTSTSRALNISFLGLNGAANGNIVFKNAGDYKVSAIAPYSPTGWLPSNYSFTGAQTATVTMQRLKINSYNWFGTTQVYYTGSIITITNLPSNSLRAEPAGKVSGDIITVSYTGNSNTNVSTNTITVTGISNANYEFSGTATGLSTTWKINKAILSISNVNIAKIYDGTTAYAGTFVKGTNYDTACSTAPAIAITYYSIEFSGKNAGTHNVIINGVAPTNSNYTINSTLTLTNGGTISRKTLTINFDTAAVTKIYDGSNILGIYSNIKPSNTSDGKFNILVGSAAGRIPDAAHLVDDFTITAKFSEVLPTPEGIAAGAYDGYVNQREIGYLKNLVFIMTSEDGSNNNYMISVAGCTASANATSITVNDKRQGESANNSTYTFTITPRDLKGDFTNTIQSYRAAGGVANTNWLDVGFNSKTAIFTADWNAARIYPVITQAWKQGEDPLSAPGVYSKYSIISGNKINDVVVGPYNSEDLLKFSLVGGVSDGGKCVYNYTYSFAQPRLVIGYFLASEEEGAKVDSLAALVLVSFYYETGAYTTFTQTEDISGILTNDDYNTLLNSEHPGIVDYLASCEVGSVIEFMPIGIDLDGRFIGEFNGIYNGNGYRINGLNIIRVTDEDGSDLTTGLFAVIGKDGTVKNTHVRSSHYTSFTQPQYNGSYEIVKLGNNYVGGIAGRNKGFIENCSFQGDIEAGMLPMYGQTAVVGGIVGENFGIIENAVAVGSIKAASTVCYIGGIAGTHAFSYTENDYVYVGGVAPGTPTKTKSLANNKMMNVLSFMEVRATSALVANNIIGGIVGRAVTATGRGDIDGDSVVYTYNSSLYSCNESALFITTNPAIPDIVYLSNSMLKMDEVDFTWTAVNRRIGTSTGTAVAGIDYNIMRKYGDESAATALNAVQTSEYDSYLRFVAKAKTTEGEPQKLDKLYFTLIEIIDVYVIKAENVGTNSAYNRYRYASMNQKIYDVYFYDKDAEGGAKVYEYDQDTSRNLPKVHLYSASVYDTLFIRKANGSFATLGSVFAAEDPLGTYYVTVDSIKYLKSSVPLFALHSTPTGATYVSSGGTTISQNIVIGDVSYLGNLANYRFASFTIATNITTYICNEGGFYGKIKGEGNVTLTVNSGGIPLFEFIAPSAVDTNSVTIINK